MCWRSYEENFPWRNCAAGGGITPPMYYRYSKVFLDRRKVIKIAMLYPAGVVGMAVEVTDMDRVQEEQRPRLLSDRGGVLISKDFSRYLEAPRG